MDPQDISRADLALPNPQEQAGALEIELLQEVPQQNSPQEKSASVPPPLTWALLFKRELEFLGVTQILIGLLCLYFGIVVYSVLDISNFDEEVFSSFKAGYPFWGSVFFVISGVLSVLSEREKAMHLVRGRLGANVLSSIVGASGMVILVFNLYNSSAYIYQCERLDENDDCLVASFTIEIVAMILFLTILGFCTAVSLTVYGIREECKGKKLPDDRLYEELNIYSPIYSELVHKDETSPVDS
ncbi:high affinity immunoglobulin epsilon receptor subunit beta [Cavia porcellus]|uniref:Membrane spanning 4-domains A2 n=1 Tax=Cavia porcellus TaxID=10141 RepID=A0A286XKN3_CAVPO|nr:high affinity immunoglobulin epsilon receptor subunit beta [Cavia porcellus]XP_013003852.1 high affinity immunoglobulin epsilon receptor subunit beta [Cavia porcellus]XP_023419161.1 high affinity immunoglobulin epsilon receptor subunit beta [Cavia porcellus]